MQVENGNIWQHRALVLIEFQQEWLSEHGKLYRLFIDKPQFLTSLENAKQIIAASRCTPIHIIHAGLRYSSDYKELGNAKHGLRAAIASHQTFLTNAVGGKFSAPFNPYAGEFVVSGRSGASAFAGSNLDSYLRNNRINTLYLMGYALHVCVESTLRAAHDLGYETILIEDASAAFTQVQRDHVLHEIVHHFGSNISTNDFLAAINEGMETYEKQ